MQKNTYALWIVFQDEELEKVIKDLNDEPFIVHAGIISIITEPIESIKKKLSHLLNRNKPFKVTLEKLTHFDDNPGGVYFLLKQNNELKEFNYELKQNIKHKSKPYFIPTHLTITYRKLPLLEKKKIIKKYSYLEGKSYSIDSIYLVQTNGKPKEWKIIERYGFYGER